MESLADVLRRERARSETTMSAEERVALSLQLGDDDLRIFCESAGLGEPEARRELRRRRQVGRTPCSFFEGES